MKDSLIKQNAIKDPTYAPYCCCCVSQMRMTKLEPLLWKCACGAHHDEREEMPRLGLMAQLEELEKK